MTYRTVRQDEYLNDLYARRAAIEDRINKMDGNRQYSEFPGWVELNAEIEIAVIPVYDEDIALYNYHLARQSHCDPLEYTDDWAGDPSWVQQCQDSGYGDFGPM
jgi:hypothetical protein